MILMIGLNEAKLIAQKFIDNSLLLVSKTFETDDLWVIGFQDKDGVIMPGVPYSVLVAKSDGKAKFLNLPSKEGFAVLDSMKVIE